MAKFAYTAKKGPKDVVEGVLEAESRAAALTHLTELGYVPVRVAEDADAAVTAGASAPVRRSQVRPTRIRASHMALMIRQFASLARSAVPLLRALAILEEQARHPYLRQVLNQVGEDVRQGTTLSDALARHPLVFSPLFINLVHSGEVSGAMDTVLERLAQQTEQEEQLRAKVRMALLYPAFVSVVGIGTVIFLMTFVMPRLSRLLTGLGDRLPLATKLLLGLSAVMSTWWFWTIVSGLVAAGILMWRSLNAPARLMFDRMLLRLPLLGPLIERTEIARFARAFGLQITNGIPILQAIDVAIRVVEHPALRVQLDRLPEGLRQGRALSGELKPLSIGSSYLVNSVAVGEESGKVGEAMTEVAAYYERESERLVQSLAALLEPCLVLMVGLVVGFIVMAVLLPIFEMSSLGGT